MAKLIYFMPTSLDGYISGDGNFDWSVPSEEALAFINDVHRPIGTYLYGRKNYETMTVWQTPEVIPGQSPATLDFARIWQAADKIVYSQSREAVSTPNTRLERNFDPQAVRAWKAQSALDLSVSGPTLAAHAIRSGLVDEYHLLVAPAMLGGGIRVLPSDVRISLELLEERRFGNGTVYLRYHGQIPAGFGSQEPEVRSQNARACEG
ncbi:MAG TPA: dihydrofolate reductase family protein [Candidatus Sulfopaludibacter sp.]|jgi:dihydrofolate reductase|nr:dihydrofolate reductase family protein [Candidatus Sulfopaludibacter sp.]